MTTRTGKDSRRTYDAPGLRVAIYRDASTAGCNSYPEGSGKKKFLSRANERTWVGEERSEPADKNLAEGGRYATALTKGGLRKLGSPSYFGPPSIAECLPPIRAPWWFPLHLAAEISSRVAGSIPFLNNSAFG